MYEPAVRSGSVRRQMPSTFSICTFAQSGCQSPGHPTSLLKLPGTLTYVYGVASCGSGSTGDSGSSGSSGTVVTPLPTEA